MTPGEIYVAAQVAYRLGVGVCIYIHTRNVYIGNDMVGALTGPLARRFEAWRRKVELADYRAQQEQRVWPATIEWGDNGEMTVSEP